jgi:small subunit ribosomal protein S17
MSNVRDIGIDVRPPAREAPADEPLNPFNGSLPVRGAVIVGRVVSDRMQSTVVVQKVHTHLVSKYQRYEKRTSRYPAHVPSNIDVAVGDEVTIAECRPISKTVKFVVVENRTVDPKAAQTQAQIEAAKKVESRPAAPKAKQATKAAATTAAPAADSDEPMEDA